MPILLEYLAVCTLHPDLFFRDQITKKVGHIPKKGVGWTPECSIFLFFLNKILKLLGHPETHNKHNKKSCPILGGGKRWDMSHLLFNFFVIRSLSFLVYGLGLYHPPAVVHDLLCTRAGARCSINSIFDPRRARIGDPNILSGIVAGGIWRESVTRRQ